MMVASTNVVRSTLDPTWQQSFQLQIPLEARYIKLVVLDQDPFSADMIGVCRILVPELPALHDKVA